MPTAAEQVEEFNTTIAPNGRGTPVRWWQKGRGPKKSHRLTRLDGHAWVMKGDSKWGRLPAAVVFVEGGYSAVTIDYIDVVTEGDLRIPLEEAEPRAKRLLELLKSACVRIHIAGSIRRQRRDVKDIELVAEPIVDVVEEQKPQQQSLFGDAPSDAPKVAHCRLQARLALETEQFGKFRGGDKQVKLVFEGTPVDLFIVRPPAQFGCQFTLRTGPQEFSRLLVTCRSQGGATPDHLTQSGGSLWDGEQAIVTPHEHAYFAALGLPFIPPTERTAERLRTEINQAAASAAVY